jgi:hypothetical protein
MESLIAFRRAGADEVLTYFALARRRSYSKPNPLLYGASSTFPMFLRS